ncbi:mechanosensitive ion channel [Rubrobacter marinus]|uniref:Mechanosensitive ion channel n=1 Tax=Rubrobacter marinus TaxID=2653852 RepID=A0A6G8PW03_9ACTN|nr:mechanosensitive ion channel domain-containing protein [Rubrobacter marinus]QIN78384.1 mechanosensitive ion channel [Rubrobacter marinus]
MFDGGVLREAFEGLAGVVGGPEVGVRLLLTLFVLAGALALRRVASQAVRRRFGTMGQGGGGGPSEAGRDDRHSAYWIRKVSAYAVWGVAVLLVIFIWAEFGRRLGFVVGAASAGVAFALQNVLGSFAAWLGILAGGVFRVGDRVMMGGVKGDVIDLSPLRTTVMEIGSPGASEDSDVWVRARQYTGRVVTVSNKAFFDEPIYNYSKDFDYVWEEISVPVSYKTAWEKARDILLEEVEGATRGFRQESAEALAEMSRRYLVGKSEVEPQVFVRLTDDWVELSVRFVIPTRSARSLKSGISESVLRRFSEENVAIASTTSEIVGFPSLRIEGLEEALDALRHRDGDGQPGTRARED